MTHTMYTLPPNTHTNDTTCGTPTIDLALGYPTRNGNWEYSGIRGSMGVGNVMQILHSQHQYYLIPQSTSVKPDPLTNIKTIEMWMFIPPF